MVRLFTLLALFLVLVNGGVSGTAVLAESAPSTSTQATVAPAMVPASMQTLSASLVLAEDARKSMLAALNEDRESLAAIILEMKRLEESMADDKTSQTPEVSDKAMLVEAWMTSDDVKLRRKMLKEVLAVTPDSGVLREAQHALKTDPVSRIRQLRRENYYNSMTGTINYGVRLASNVFTLNTDSIVRLAIDFVFLWEPFVELSPQDRNAVVLYDQSMDEMRASGEDTDGMRKMVERLRRHLQKRLAKDEIQCAKWYMQHEMWEEARASFARAGQLRPNYEKAEKGALKAIQNLSAENRARLHSLEMSEEPASTGSEKTALRELALAAVGGSKKDAAAQSAKFRKENPVSRFSDDAAWLEASVSDTESQSATQFLEALSPQHANGAAINQAYWESPDANPAAALKQSEDRLKKDIWAYVMLGRKEDPYNPTIHTNRRDQWHHYLSSFGLLLPFDWARRGIKSSFGTPVDDSAWRSAAIQYLQWDSADPAQRTKVAARLAESYERQGFFEQARKYHAMAFGEDAEYEKKLREKTAQRMRELANEQSDPVLQRSLLQQVVDLHPDTKAAQKARKRLLALDGKNSDLYQIKRADLVQWPDLWMKRGLRLDTAWFDGHEANGEMGDDGLHFLAPDGKTVEFTVKYNRRKEKKQVVPDKAASEEIKPVLQAWQKESRARERAETLLSRPLLPIDLQGSAGPGGLDVYPRLMPISFDEETLPLYRSPFEVSAK